LTNFIPSDLEQWICHEQAESVADECVAETKEQRMSAFTRFAGKFHANRIMPGKFGCVLEKIALPTSARRSGRRTPERRAFRAHRQLYPDRFLPI
jgi:hypothetical protein